MRALSLLEPWATLVAIGAKRFETRTRRTQYRGPLAIHASRQFTGWQRYRSSWGDFSRALGRADILPSGGLVGTLGHVIAIVDLVDVIPAEQAVSEGLVPRDSSEFLFGTYAPERFAWKLENARRVEPVPFKGTQGFFFVPDSMLREVGAEMAATQ